MKEIVWKGNSRDILCSFSDGVRRDLGTGLMYLQVGAIPDDTKPFKTGMPGLGNYGHAIQAVITE